jgi:hypothetical protein
LSERQSVDSCWYIPRIYPYRRKAIHYFVECESGLALVSGEKPSDRYHLIVRRGFCYFSVLTQELFKCHHFASHDEEGTRAA